ncbi:copper amine oxidase N-terminal domain-containing protein [Desulfuribacillus stibiiarsenatis]|nr:stalk domain-containing protein [Desulfuribacillus stibiiarsenatis]
MANIRVVVNGSQVSFDQEPIIVNDRILVPIRAIAESLGTTVEWQEPYVIITKGEKKVTLTINSTTAYNENRQVFFMEQPPIIINGRTLVSLRFVAEALGASVTWDDNNKVVTIISDEDLAGLEQSIAGDNYYKLYDPIIGPSIGPAYEEAEQYVLEQRLLNHIKEIQYTYIRFNEFGSYNTMVIGNDEVDNEKAVWLVKDKYTDDITVTGSTILKDGISQEIVFSVLKNKEIDRESISKIYIAPYEKNQIYWFVIAEKGETKCYYCLDFYTGDIVIELSVK